MIGRGVCTKFNECHFENVAQPHLIVHERFGAGLADFVVDDVGEVVGGHPAHLQHIVHIHFVVVESGEPCYESRSVGRLWKAQHHFRTYRLDDIVFGEDALVILGIETERGESRFSVRNRRFGLGLFFARYGQRRHHCRENCECE